MRDPGRLPRYMRERLALGAVLLAAIAVIKAVRWATGW